MKKHAPGFCSFLVVVLLAGCSRPTQPSHVRLELGELVTNMVHHAEAGDAGFFLSLLDRSESAQAPKLMDMIRCSGMLTNYSSRIQTNSPNGLRLGYHDLACACHFQVDLSKDGPNWRLKRIWFCR